MPFKIPFMSSNRYGGGGPGYGAGITNRKPSYTTQLSSDGYSSTGGNYGKLSYGNSSYGGGSYRPTSSASTYTERYPSSPHDRPSSVASAPYTSSSTKNYGRMNSYGSAGAAGAGYTSDYGRSGYASGSGYKKSGYGSDYGHSGYASGYASDYGRSGYASGTGYGSGTGYASDYGTGKYGQNSGGSSGYHKPASGSGNYTSSYRRPEKNTTSEAPSRYAGSGGAYGSGRANQGTSSPYVRSNCNTPRSSYTTRSTARGRDSGASSSSSYNRSSYSRSVSREEPTVAPPATKTTTRSGVGLGRVAATDSSAATKQSSSACKAEHRKSKECKAPADFTSDDSSSSDSDSQNEDAVCAQMVSRATSPTQKPLPPGDYSKCISATVNCKRPQRNSKVKTEKKDVAVQTGSEDVTCTEKERHRYVPSTSSSSSAITKPSPGYYDRYYGRYTSPYGVGRSTTATSVRSYSGRSDPSPPKKLLSPSSATACSQQNSHEDGRAPKSPTASARSPSQDGSGSQQQQMQQGSTGSQGFVAGKSKSPSSPRSPSLHGSGNHQQQQQGFLAGKTNPGQNTESPQGPPAGSSEAENKEFRKSVLNMNRPAEDRKHERSPGLRKTQSWSRVASEEGRKKASRDSSSSSSSESEPQHQQPDRKICRTHSRSKMNHERESEDRSINKSHSRSKMVADGGGQRRVGGSSNKGSSQEDLVDRRSYGSRERLLPDDGSRPRSRTSSREDILQDDQRRRSPRNRMLASEGGRKKGSSSSENLLDVEDNPDGWRNKGHRRNGSLEGVLDENPDGWRNKGLKRNGSLEGVLDDRPPRPLKYGSRENILDEKPAGRRRHEPAGEVQTSRGGSSGEERRSSQQRQVSRSRSKEKILDDKIQPSKSGSAARSTGIPVPRSGQQQKAGLVSPQRNRPSSEEDSEEEEQEGGGNGRMRKRSSPDGIDVQWQTGNSCARERQGGAAEDKVLVGRSRTTTKDGGGGSRIPCKSSKKAKEKFISNMKDIDSLLGDEKASGSGTFEDFERRFSNDRRMIIISAPPPPSDAELKGRQKEDAKKTLGMFIGKCKDIDDVLGATEAPRQRPTVLHLKKDVDSEEEEEVEQQRRGQECSSGEETDEEEEEEEEVSASSSAVEEVEADKVKVHDSKAQQSQLETYTEEIDSSAVRIRESVAQAPELETYTEEIDLSGVRIRERLMPMKGNITTIPKTNRLDDCTLQLYKHSNSHLDYGTYLDLESTIDEQQEEFDGFLDNRKNAIILRTQLPVRVHAIIEKLMHSEGRDLRRSLFSLKQIFQDDKDLVHEFVQNDGLACLIKVGSEADQNYQNYILRALGQVMLYVDGMNGVIDHNETIQWLYSLISSKYRLVVKTALKLLLVFVEYTESNCLLLINAVNSVDSTRGVKPWTNIMYLLNEKDSVDMELLIFAMTLINKMLNGIPDQDTYYDVADCLEEQGMERIIQRYMSKQGTDLDLLQQFQIYEAVLKQEDGDEDGPVIPLDPNFSRQVPRSRKSLDDNDRRKSRRHSVGTVIITPPTRQMVSKLPITPEEPLKRWRRDDNKSGDLQSKRNEIKTNGTHKEINGSRTEMNGTHIDMNGTHLELSDLNGVTPGLARRRRERDARHRSFIKEQEGTGTAPGDTCEDVRPIMSLSIDKPLMERQRVQIEDENRKNREISKIPCRFVDDKAKVVDTNKIENNQRFAPTSRSRNNKEVTTEHPPPVMRQQENGLATTTNKKSWMLSMMYSKSQDEENRRLMESKMIPESSPVKENEKLSGSISPSPRISQAEVFDLRREGTVKDIQKKLRTQESLTSPTDSNHMGDFSGLVNKAKEGLNKSTSRTEVKSPGVCPSGTPESKKAENDFQWEQLMKTLDRPLRIKDMDFTDLGNEDDIDIFNAGMSNGMPNDYPPPPSLIPVFGMSGIPGAPPPPPPPQANGVRGPPPPPPPFGGPAPPPFGPRGQVPPSSSGIPSPYGSRFGHGPPSNGVSANNTNHHQQQQQAAKTIKKNKKTVKLFWKEVREDPIVAVKVKSLIWDELKPVNVDTQKLEHLFENRAKDLMSKKQQEMNRNKEIIVLDPKRSNAINIGMTKLPPPRTIKTAILKMDSTIMNREGIEKILTIMMPTEEERAKIMEAQMGNPDVPLGSAEQFLLTLASISELPARLKLWAFKLDYDIMEREVAEPLMDLKQGLDELKQNKTFRSILATLLSIGNFLNGIEAKGFQIDYLAKVPEVKDTVHKHSLLHHLCHMVMEKFPDTSDLYCEIGAISRASKVDFDDLAINLLKMETECKASWDHLKAIAKHDGSTNMKAKMSEFLAECAERIIVLGIIHRRVINRFFKFLIYLGVPPNNARELKVNQFLKTVSEFALEYRTTRERVIQQLEKKATHRERNKTRGKMITDVGKFKSKDVQADEELRQLLGSGVSDNEDYKWGTVPGFRGRLRKPDLKGGSVGRNTPLLRDESLTESMTDGDDEILESLVKTATAPSLRSTPRERKRASRQADRKSLRRTLKNGLSDEEKKFLAAFST